MSSHVYKVIEIVGSSETGSDAAANRAMGARKGEQET